MDKSTSIPQDYSQDDLVELLRQYYKRLFPSKLYHRWLAYGGGIGVNFPCIQTHCDFPLCEICFFNNFSVKELFWQS